MGGNVANGSPIGDSAPVLIALDAQLELQQGARVRRLPLQDFYVDYMKNALMPGEFVSGIAVPRGQGGQLRAYKISKRFDCDISAVCAGLWVLLDGDTVRGVRLAFGGMAAIVRRAGAPRRRCSASPGTRTALQAAQAALAQDFTPLTRHARQCRLPAAGGAEPAAPLLAGNPARRRAAGSGPHACGRPRREPVRRPATRTRRRRCRARTASPQVGVSRPHESAHLHVAGAAPYTDDIPELAGTLHAALGLSPLAHGVIEAIDLDRIRALPGVVDVFSAARHARRQRLRHPRARRPDPRRRGGDTLRYVGQPVFAVIARTRDAARRAAALAPHVIRARGRCRRCCHRRRRMPPASTWCRRCTCCAAMPRSPSPRPRTG